MANATIGIILITSADIVQVGCNQQHIHVHPFGVSNAFTQAANPQGVVPVVTAPGASKVFMSQLFYRVEHKG